MIELLIAFIAILFLYYLKNYVFDSDSFYNPEDNLDDTDYNPDYNQDNNTDDNCLKDISGNISRDISRNVFSFYNPNDKYIKKMLMKKMNM